MSWTEFDGARLALGDCLDVMGDIPDGSIDLVLADPPYGTTANGWDEVVPFDPMWAQLLRVCKPNAAILMFCQLPFLLDLAASNRAMLRYEWVWLKSRPTGFLNAGKMPMKTHENILVFYRSLPVFHPQMGVGEPYTRTWANTSSSNYKDLKPTRIIARHNTSRNPVDVVAFGSTHVGAGREHFAPTCKPVDLLRYMIRTYTDAGETVLDPFMGSGSTGVAALKEGRRFIGIERDAGYFATARGRIGAEAAQGRLF